MLTLQIEISVDEYIWDEWAETHDLDPEEHPEDIELIQFLDDEFNIYADSARML